MNELLSLVVAYLSSAKGQQIDDALIGALMAHLFTKAPVAATQAMMAPKV